MALDDLDDLAVGSASDEDRAAIEAVPERYRVNLTALAQVVGRTTVTIREDMRRHGDAFPVVYRGSNGRDYVFDARVVAGFYRDLEEAERRRREEDEERVRGLRLELLGGESVDEGTVDLSPKDKRELLQAEYLAGQVRRQRGELVRAAEVEDCARLWNARVREEMTSAGARIVEELALDREAARRVEGLIADALRAASSSAAKSFAELGADQVEGALS